MRANRMLHAPGIAPYDPSVIGPARFIAYAEVPWPAAYGMVAVMRLSLADHLAAAGQPCERRHDKRQGGWYRIAGIALPGGRYAFVQEFEHHPGEVGLHLPVWREQQLHRQDYFAARALFPVADDQVTLCDGPYLWR